MPRFTLRKGKEESDGDGVLGRSFTTFKKKKPAEPPKLKFDIATALPTTDEFRQSLLMANLSARFSMLREQDDPSTKIGKASDDSVLFPKRASRLNLFTHNPLADISEVDSIRESIIQPPFAQEDRSHSIGSDDYTSDDGAGVMRRGRPTEGNNLFGGRQKLYRIPAGSSSAKSLSGSEGMGRHMYESDVSLSLFQQMRQNEREERMRERLHLSESSQNTESDEREVTSSPTTAFSKDRGTTSSTNSGPLSRHTSTAATSVTSETPAPYSIAGHMASPPAAKPNFDDVHPMERGQVAPRKVHGQPLERPLHFQRMGRNPSENLTRPGPPGDEKSVHALATSRSGSNLTSAGLRGAPASTSSNFRSASPPLSATTPGGLPSRDPKQNGGHLGHVYGSIPPLSPPASDEDILAYTSIIKPEDRGKATAMGLFNRPQRQYDEQQFLRRQMQMHEGRISPMPQRGSPVRREGSESPQRPDASSTPRATPEASNEPRLGPLNVTRRGPQTSPSWNTKSTPPPQMATSGPPKQRPQPSISPEIMSRARARADSLIRRQNAELKASEEEQLGRQPLGSSTAKASPIDESPVVKDLKSGTFFNNFSPSDDEDDQPFEFPGKLPQVPDDIHPALRDGRNDFNFDLPAASTGGFSGLAALPERNTQRSPSGERDEPSPERRSPGHGADDESASDSPSGLGLGGLIRSHLRRDSDKSSIYPAASANLSQSMSPDSPRIGSSTRSLHQTESIHSNPWEYDDMRRRPSNADDEIREPAYLMAHRAKQMLGQAAALQGQARSKALQVLGEEAPRLNGDNVNDRPWREEVGAQHRRGASTETQHERAELKQEMAERRRRVQETLKGISPRNDQTNGVGPADRNGPDAGNGFPPVMALKPGKNAMRGWPPESQAKAMKMLGISNIGSTDMAPRPPDDPAVEEEERMLRDFARRKQRSPPAPRQAPRPHHTPPPAASPSPSPYEGPDRSRQGSATPGAGKVYGRDRSNSGVSGRSRSHAAQHREEMDRSRAAGASSRAGPPETADKTSSVVSLPRPSLEQGDQPLYEAAPSAMSGRYQAVRPGLQGYFEGRPSHSDTDLTSAPPPRIPGMAFSANSTPPLGSPSVASLSTVATAPHPSPDGVIPAALRDRSGSVASTRKKSVTKNMISEPTFLSMTSNIPAVTLPAPPDFKPRLEISEPPPPVPAMNPRRRRQTTTQTLFGGLARDGKIDLTQGVQIMPESPRGPQGPEERNTFSDDNEKRPPKPRARLRKTSSEGGNMNARARQQALKAPSPAMPTFPRAPVMPSPFSDPPLDGGMF